MVVVMLLLWLLTQFNLLVFPPHTQVWWFGVQRPIKQSAAIVITASTTRSLQQAATTASPRNCACT